MKLFKIGILTIILLCTSACSDNNDKTEPPIFPNVEIICTSPNSEYTFSFSANVDWKLTSTAIWCTFPEMGEKVQTITGAAGAHSVKLKISDEGLKFDQTTKAKLTLSMDGISQVVAEIEREAKQYKLTFFNVDGEETQSLLVGPNGELNFSAQANFDFAATKYPEWIEEIVMYSDIDNPSIKRASIKVKDNYLKNSQTDNIIEFSNEKGNVIFPLLISYTGMDPNKIIIKSNDIETGNFYNWIVSKDGKLFSKKNDITSEYIEIANGMSFNITAVDDKYTPVYIEEYNNDYYFDANEWMHLSQQGETATFTVDASDRERKGLVYVFPDAVYNTIKDNLRKNIIDEDGYIKYEYEQKYFLIAFTQKEEAEAGAFFIRNGLTWQEITNEKVTNPSILEYVMGNCMYYGEDIYSVHVNPGTSLIIYPQLPESIWTCEMGAMIMGDEHSIVESIVLEPLIDDTGHSIQFKVPESATKPIYVVIKDNMWQFLKVLVVIPKNNN